MLVTVWFDTLICIMWDSHKASIAFAFTVQKKKKKKSLLSQTEEKEEEDLSGEPKASPSADTTILFVKGEGKSSVPVYHFKNHKETGSDCRNRDCVCCLRTSNS